MMSVYVLRTYFFPGPIWFSFTVKLIAGPGRVYNYFRRGYLHPPKRNRLWNKNNSSPTIFLIFIFMGMEIGGSTYHQQTPTPFPQVPLEASRGVSASN